MVGPPRFYPPYTNDHAFYICVSSLREGVKKIEGTFRGHGKSFFFFIVVLEVNENE